MLEYFYVAKVAKDAAITETDLKVAPDLEHIESPDIPPAMNDQERLLRRIGALELAVETMMRLLLKSGTLKEEDFFQLAREIDMEDGLLDGRRDVQKLKRVCTTCQRPNPAERFKCMWCGGNLGETEPVVL